MTRREALRRFILSLLAVVFGPEVWQLLDADELDAVIEDACPAVMFHGAVGWAQIGPMNIEGILSTLADHYGIDRSG